MMAACAAVACLSPSPDMNLIEQTIGAITSWIATLSTPPAYSSIRLPSRSAVLADWKIWSRDMRRFAVTERPA